MPKEESILQVLFSSGMLDELVEEPDFCAGINSRDLETLKTMTGIIYTTYKMESIPRKAALKLCSYARVMFAEEKILAEMNQRSLDAIMKSPYAQEMRKKMSEKYLRVHYFLCTIADVAVTGDIIDSKEAHNFKSTIAFLFAEDAKINS